MENDFAFIVGKKYMDIALNQIWARNYFLLAFVLYFEVYVLLRVHHHFNNFFLRLLSLVGIHLRFFFNYDLIFSFI